MWPSYFCIPFITFLGYYFQNMRSDKVFCYTMLYYATGVLANNSPARKPL